MDKHTLDLTKLRQAAVEANFMALLNSYCREFTNWSRYQGVPRYDAMLAAHFASTGYDFHLRFDFAAAGVEVYAPVVHFGESGRHIFGFPIVERHLETDVIMRLTPARFVVLATLQARAQYPEVNDAVTQERLENSIHNLVVCLDYFQRTGHLVNGLKQSFIQSEQSLILGHSVHPLPKGREGFNEEELLSYSPETGGQFPLHFFLIHPDHVTERQAEGVPVTIALREALLGYATTNAAVKGLLEVHPDWKVVPMHPWEAAYVLQQPDVKAMAGEGLLYDLGARGPLFTATSSVRTVYSAESEWMFKFSLHVKITNSERVNLVRELHRGYDFSRLLQTPWGKGLQKDYPEIEFITDPAFITVSYGGRVIDGFNTSIRRNPFRKEAVEKNVTLLAALCQDGLLGQPARMTTLIQESARLMDKPVRQVAVEWFQQYLHICVRPVVGIFNQYGLACEFHQQNVLVELDSRYFPAKLYFRDNQGFFFREGKSEVLLANLPELAQESGSLIPEEYIVPKYTYYLLINHLLGIVSALGCNGLADEKALVDLIYKEFKHIEHTDTTGLVPYVLHSRDWLVKANLLTSLCNLDEASAPIENPAIYVNFPNPLNKYFFAANLIKPVQKGIVYSRYFPKEDITISIRPFDVDRDLEMVHDWFNQEHTKDIWKMDGPIRQLEVFYRTLMPSDHSHSFVGEIDGVPTFTFEPYWPMRDTVGAYYEALATDYGAHLLIAPTDKNKKFTFPSTQVLLDWVFGQPEVGKCIGEAAVESRAMHILVTRMGFRHQRVIEMPHKNANLTFCLREWYWEKFPESKDIVISTIAERSQPMIHE